jgi:pimeloyl-[acyl-carrier protein] methyl ester esterase
MSDKQPLVLLHGWGMNNGVWSTLLPELEARYTPIPIALPGHDGQPLDGTEATLSAWAAEVLAKAPQQAIWLGWSLGGMVACQAALDAPERVGSLICVAASPRFVRDPEWPSAMDPQVLEGFAQALAKDHQASLNRFLALQVRGDEDARDRLRQLKRSLQNHAPATPEALRDGLRLLAEGDLRPRLPTLQVPSLWLFGERDTLVPKGAAEQVQDLLSDRRCKVMPRAAHAPFLSHPQRFLDQLHQTEQFFPSS